MIPILLLSLLAIGFIAFVTDRLYRRPGDEGSDEASAPASPRPEGCCGQHEICEKESLLDGISYEAEYYEDEELDAYQGRQADSYSAAEIERFEEVLTTMRPEEVAGWVRSLRLRGVALPEALRDEVFLLVREVREEALDRELGEKASSAASAAPAASADAR